MEIELIALEDFPWRRGTVFTGTYFSTAEPEATLFELKGWATRAENVQSIPEDIALLSAAYYTNEIARNTLYLGIAMGILES